MKTLLSVAVLVSALLFIGRLQADTITFENFAEPIGENNAWTHTFPGGGTPGKNSYGEDATDVVYDVGNGVRLYQQYGVSYYDGNTYPFWSGIALSTKTDTSNPSFTNDAVSVTGSGAVNSQTYAIVAGSGNAGLLYTDAKLPLISLPTGAVLQSIDITNTAYTYDSLTNGDDFTDALSDSAGSYFKLHIYGIDSDDGLAGTLTVDLGTYADGALNYWKTVDFSDDFAGAVELRFAFDESDAFGWLNYPAYVAIDNLMFSIQNNETPEPATLLIFGLGVAGLALRRRK